jgi:hypothetical protein
MMLEFYEIEMLQKARTLELDIREIEFKGSVSIFDLRDAMGWAQCYAKFHQKYYFSYRARCDQKPPSARISFVLDRNL